MISRLIFLVLLAAAAFGQVTAVLIQDTLRVPVNGELFRGRVQITPPNVVCGGQSYKPVPVNVQVSGGVLSVSLVPNEQCSPAGTVYHVRFQAQQGARWEEVWRVPVSLVPITLEDVYLTTGGPSPGGGGASIWGQITGTLGDQTDLAAALNGRAPISHTHLPADITGLQATVRGYLSAVGPITYDSNTGQIGLNTVPLDSGGTNNTTWTATRCVRVSADGTRLESTDGPCVEPFNLQINDEPLGVIDTLNIVTGPGIQVTESTSDGKADVTINSTGGGGGLDPQDHTQLYVREDFVAVKSGLTIGLHGTVFTCSGNFSTGGSVGVLAGQIGGMRIKTGSTIGHNIYCAPVVNGGVANPLWFSPSMAWKTRFQISNLASTCSTDRDVRLGINSAVDAVGSDGIYLEKLGADTNWFFVARASSTETRTDTGVACGTNGTVHTFQVESTGSAVRAKINAENWVTLTENVPTAAMMPWLQLVTNTAAFVEMTWLKWDGHWTGLTVPTGW